jgi:hypothetical protein
MKLRITYRSSDDKVTERVISDVVLETPDKVHAFCHLRAEGRSFVLSRIEKAVDLETGRSIPDIWVFFGLPTRKPPAPTMPIFPESPQSMWTAEAQNLRKADKYALFSRFKFDVIADMYRAKLWALFRDRCFRCETTKGLELDHHIPQYLGGRLVAGNIVVLCSRCNLEKKDKHPNKFYSSQQLLRLRDIFQTQIELFDFRFNWSRWNRNRKEYLLSLGVPLKDIEQALHTEEEQHNDDDHDDGTCKIELKV